MVVLPLVGGLGNQFFIRAFGYALEAKGNEVVFDRGPLDNDDARGYVLDKWNCEVLFGKPCGERIQEPDLTYHPELLKKYDRDVTLTGYWQSDKYWDSEVQEKSRRAFTLRNEPGNKTSIVAQQIEKSNSVSLHIRRTDNLSERGLKYHGLASGEYYARAIDYIAARVKHPHFFVFSDDIVWCKKNIWNFGFPLTFVDHNTPGCIADSEYKLTKAEGTQHEDMFLMALCKHHIVARSTFSWWGSWLGQNPETICIAPEVWFVQNNELSRDIVPDSWVRL